MRIAVKRTEVLDPLIEGRVAQAVRGGPGLDSETWDSPDGPPSGEEKPIDISS
jgi:hypothetical protein